jgi:hypothetical protein
MERVFKCIVTRTDEYIIKIDEDKIDQDLIPEFERDIHKLKGDKIKSLAESMCNEIMDNGSQHYEGIGYIETDGLKMGQECVTGIEIETVMLEYIDIEVDEKEK